MNRRPPSRACTPSIRRAGQTPEARRGPPPLALCRGSRGCGDGRPGPSRRRFVRSLRWQVGRGRMAELPRAGGPAARPSVGPGRAALSGLMVTRRPLPVRLSRPGKCRCTTRHAPRRAARRLAFIPVAFRAAALCVINAGVCCICHSGSSAGGLRVEFGLDVDDWKPLQSAALCSLKPPQPEAHVGTFDDQK